MIPGAEIAEVLRKAIRGEITVRPMVQELTWEKTYCGNVQFLFGDWIITFFNDCDELDYIDFVISPDGRESEFADWVDDPSGNNEDPIDQLTQNEFVALEQLLGKAV